jgi:endo-1,3(4)-beta-glucanase
VWTHPYHLVWAKGVGETKSYGMAISHTERSQFAYGPDAANPTYFISPIGINHMVLSADELGNNTIMTVEELQAFSAYANFAPNSSYPVVMTMPVVQGMGMITAVYKDALPMITSGVYFRSFDYIGLAGAGTHKWRVSLNDNSQWLLYVTPMGTVGVPPFSLNSTSLISGPANFKGTVQVSKNPAGISAEDAFDAAAGAYAANATITGSVNGNSGSYTLSWGKGGVPEKTLLMYALPHHVESFDQETNATRQGFSLVTTTKGYAEAVLANRITMLENDLPTGIGFAPWSKNAGNGASGGVENVDLGTAALALVNNASHYELSQDFIAQTSLNSMYYSGKGLAKFAAICYTVSNIAGNRNLAASGLLKLKDAFNVFVNNTQPEPLVYDTVWKGIVSGATYHPPYDPGMDFGNTLYNDHHFHYGYFLYTAAVIGYLDPDWLTQGSNKAWVNGLARDYANPVTDAYFPFQRSFDWFHGHSWAKGLFESGDGKDQESTSEDTFATYALKMWGRITRDANMEARGNLQLAVQARSLRNYFLMESSNKNQPQQFLHNKVTGILFENKIDHTTYFGSNTEYIEGIHMIPLNPSSAYTRRAQFVQEEWDTYFSDGRVNQVQGGWKAILYANYALINPQTAYDFFADPDFDTTLDGGASRTWYLAYTAALLGVKNGNVQPDITFGSTGAPNTTVEESGTSTKPVSEDEGVVPQDTRPWPHGFNWPQTARVQTASQPAPLRATRPGTSRTADPTPTATHVAEQEWLTDDPMPQLPPPQPSQEARVQGTPSPVSTPEAALDIKPSSPNRPSATIPDDQTVDIQNDDEVRQQESPDKSWAMQDKEADVSEQDSADDDGEDGNGEEDDGDFPWWFDTDARDEPWDNEDWERKYDAGFVH